MSRATMMFVMLALLVSTRVVGAHDGRDSVIAYADDTGDAGKDTRASDEPRRAPRPRTAQAPAPPAPPAPPSPRAPRAPKAPRPPGNVGGVNVTINGDKIDLSGIDGMVRGQLDGVREMIRNNPNIPPKLRDKLLARFDKVRVSMDRRLARLKGKSLAEVGEELEQMGEELEQAMDGLDEELEQLGEQLGKNFKFKFKDKSNKHDDDEDDEDDEDSADGLPMAPDLDDVDDGDMRDALNNLKGMAIKPQQKEQIQRIRADADRLVGEARARLEESSKRLEGALANPRTTPAEVEKLVDEVSRNEASIRKARIVSWVKARAILDAGQRKQIEAAAGKRHK
jgi:hypothetical protein